MLYFQRCVINDEPYLQLMRSVPISQSFAVTSIGSRLMTDSKEILDSRKETSGPLDHELPELLTASFTEATLSDPNLSLQCVCVCFFL